MPCCVNMKHISKKVCAVTDVKKGRHFCSFWFILYLCRCYSYVGRRYYAQELSLQQSGCVYHDTVQHEVLHALGFNHEQTRSDRDQYIRVLWENITAGLSVFTFHYPWQQYKYNTERKYLPAQNIGLLGHFERLNAKTATAVAAILNFRLCLALHKQCRRTRSKFIIPTCLSIIINPL